jgi:hypothetical protein
VFPANDELLTASTVTRGKTAYLSHDYSPEYSQA